MGSAPTRTSVQCRIGRGLRDPQRRPCMMPPMVSRRPRLMLAALVALLVVVAVSVAIETGREKGGPPIGAPALRTRALPADAFVNSIGVSVHLPYTDTAYARQAEIIARLRELGLRHIRDGM